MGALFDLAPRRKVWSGGGGISSPDVGCREERPMVAFLDGVSAAGGIGMSVAGGGVGSVELSAG